MTIERKAIEVLRHRGHCKGVLEDVDYTVCALGALRLAHGWAAFTSIEEQFGEAMETLKRLNRIVMEQYPDRVPLPLQDGYTALTTFNDHPDTTVEDVERVLTKSAIEAEELL